MYSVQAWEVERMSMLQIGILGVAGVLLALPVQKREIGIWHLYQYRSWHADLYPLLGKISLLKRCTE